jgi:DNA-directed RNA polymerase II subunit RPB2
MQESTDLLVKFIGHYGLAGCVLRSYEDALSNIIAMVNATKITRDYQISFRGAEIEIGKVSTPAEARLLSADYVAHLKATVVFSRQIGPNTYLDVVDPTPQVVTIDTIPLMVGSSRCARKSTNEGLADQAECPYSPTGYFIVNGTEYCLVGHDHLRYETPYILMDPGLKRYVCRNTCVCPGTFNTVLVIVYRRKHTFFVKFEGTGTNEINLVSLIDLICRNNRVGGISQQAFNERMSYFLSDRALGLFEDAGLGVGGSSNSQTRVDALAQFASCFSLTWAHHAAEKEAFIAQLPKKLGTTAEVCEAEEFPAMLFPGRSAMEKIDMLLLMAVKLAEFRFRPKELRGIDDRDSFANKRVELAGPSIFTIFAKKWNERVEGIRSETQKSASDVVRVLRSVNTKQTAWKAYRNGFTTNNWGVGKNSKEHIVQECPDNILSRISLLDNVSSSKGNQRSIDVRLAVYDQAGYVCFSHTPEGDTCGTAKHLALTCLVTSETSGAVVYHALVSHFGHDFTTPPASIGVSQGGVISSQGGAVGGVISSQGGMAVGGVSQGGAVGGVMSGPAVGGASQVRPERKAPVVINGTVAGWMLPSKRTEIVALRRAGILNEHTMIVYDERDHVISISTSSSRLVRPLLVVEKGELVLWKVRREYRRASREWRWEDMSFAELVRMRAIEFVDVREQKLHCYVARSTRDLRDERRGNASQGSRGAERGEQDNTSHDRGETASTPLTYTHCELHPVAILSVVASHIAAIHHNQAPRNNYQCNMSTQALGISRSDASLLWPTTSKGLMSASPRFFRSIMEKYSHVDLLPSGRQVCVAITVYGGNNQEDSVIMNRQALDLGLVRYHIVRTVSKEIKDKTRLGFSQQNLAKYRKLRQYATQLREQLEEEATARDERAARVMSARDREGRDERNESSHQGNGGADVRKLEGIPAVGTVFEVGDAVIAAYNSETGADDSEMMPEMTPPMRVAAVMVSDVTEGAAKLVKVRLEEYRRPQIGDKGTFTPAQKGTIGEVRAPEDMPTIMGPPLIDGIRPDVIFNPHGVIGRMTMSLVIEVLANYVGIVNGPINATPFTELNCDQFKNFLRMNGIDEEARVQMMNGETGEIMDTLVYFGSAYYQPLKHLVEDKKQVRNPNGPHSELLHGPSKGRSKGGGLKFGYMEGTTIHCMGADGVLEDRLVDNSAPFVAVFCRRCGQTASGNWSTGRYECPCSVPCRHCHQLGDQCGCHQRYVVRKQPYSFHLVRRVLESGGIALRLLEG